MPTPDEFSIDLESLLSARPAVEYRTLPIPIPDWSNVTIEWLHDDAAAEAGEPAAIECTPPPDLPVGAVVRLRSDLTPAEMESLEHNVGLDRDTLTRMSRHSYTYLGGDRLMGHDLNAYCPREYLTVERVLDSSPLRPGDLVILHPEVPRYLMDEYTLRYFDAFTAVPVTYADDNDCWVNVRLPHRRGTFSGSELRMLRRWLKRTDEAPFVPPCPPLSNRQKRKFRKALWLLRSRGLTQDVVERYAETYYARLCGRGFSAGDIPQLSRHLMMARQETNPRGISGGEPPALLGRLRQVMVQPPQNWPRGIDRPGQMVGIELEFVPRRGGYTRPDILGVHLGYDNSVDSHSPEFTDESDSEARMCFAYGQWSRLRRACKALTDQGCVANPSCGLHVHLDMRGRKERKVRAIARRLADALPVLNACVPAGRKSGARAERYCRQGYSFSDRYYAINGVAFHKYGTLEVRLFPGSLDAEKIQRWVELLWWLAYRRGKRITSVESFLESNAPADLKAWVIHRAQRYAPEYAGKAMAGNAVELSEV